MAPRALFERANPSHHVTGYCCVLLAIGYVIAIVTLVGYLIACLMG
jgi:hypothetical protein